jgi:hypothetical protein
VQKLGSFAAALLLLLALPKAAAADDADRIAALLEGEPDVWIMNRYDDGVVLGVGDRGNNLPGEIVVSPRRCADLPGMTTPSFYIRLDNHLPDPALSARLIQLADKVVARDDGKLGFTREPWPGRPPPWIFLWEALAFGAAAAVIGVARRGRVTWELKLPHLLPAIIQTAILAYWTLYWRGFAELIPSVLLQIVLAYAIDASIMLAWLGTWKVGFGPFPIILSATLFNWFDPDTTTIMIAAAMCSRALIRRRGRHILNPSAFGLSVALLLTLLFPATFTHGGPFILFSLAPNLPELVVLLALIPQVRFRIVLASLGVYFGILWAHQFYNNVPPVLQPGTLLMITLFVTDPATIPRTPVGQILFGVSIGFISAAVTAAGYALGAGDERLNKVLPVVIANLLVPLWDAIGERAARWRLAFLEPRWNLAHVAVWILVIGSLLGHGKAEIFNAARHWTNRTPLIVRDADGVPRCEHNPIFCRPFTFRLEALGWLSRLSGDPSTPH